MRRMFCTGWTETILSVIDAINKIFLLNEVEKNRQLFLAMMTM